MEVIITNRLISFTTFIVEKNDCELKVSNTISKQNTPINIKNEILIGKDISDVII